MTDVNFAIAEESDEPAVFSPAARCAGTGASAAESPASRRGKPPTRRAGGRELRAPSRVAA